MTQKESTGYLGAGDASIKRWELGAIEDRAMDNLIRLRTDIDKARAASVISYPGCQQGRQTRRQNAKRYRT